MKKITLIFTLALVIASCGKKDETQTTPPQNEQQMTQQQMTQQQMTQQQTQSADQTKQDEQKNDEMKKEEEKKENVQKKEDYKNTDSKPKDEKIRKTDDVSKKENKQDNRSDTDFTQIYSKKCAKCHGKDLKGKKDGGPDLTSSKVKSKDNKKLYNIISNGVKADNDDDEDMPAFKSKLTADEINAAIEFIKKH